MVGNSFSWVPISMLPLRQSGLGSALSGQWTITATRKGQLATIKVLSEEVCSVRIEAEIREGWKVPIAADYTRWKKEPHRQGWPNRK